MGREECKAGPALHWCLLTVIWRTFVLKEAPLDIAPSSFFPAFSSLCVLAFRHYLIRRRASSLLAWSSLRRQTATRECSLIFDRVFSLGVPKVLHFFLKSTRRLPVENRSRRLDIFSAPYPVKSRHFCHHRLPFPWFPDYPSPSLSVCITLKSIDRSSHCCSHCHSPAF